ncbi:MULTISPECIES: 50S ribosomal protein L23 [Treponema]|jgi:large subunit ribosomal protein L23|uniref:Large ribosomal subunit protein uL23 n=1 Tax=Treponema saccharophilum DSM 2985 TaxID=907348 RepID=H7ENE1_9SPIR|nr:MULTISPECIES: 50S ribosomal protein L23 [Treponema]EIC00869.1 LSU ribosomal protein L23P [Treponema saccharophilum DSM 2985]MBQ5538275.1 50S ribosomal protein L23 [Treponema sp.]BDC95211.1 50S ribosomal protein L23 [Treponema saccharophilum]
MTDLHDIIIAPVLSEKATALREEGKYVFKVQPSATKLQIKDAVTKLFNVKVLSCTTLNVLGKVKRVRGKLGKTSSWKKAIVRLAPGEVIKVFEGV